MIDDKIKKYLADEHIKTEKMFSDERIGDFAYRIGMKVNETYDDFIFSTIAPYAERETQLVIGKQFLVDAIQKQRPVDIIKGDGVALDSCPKCHHFITDEFIYCPRCGQKFNRADS